MVDVQKCRSAEGKRRVGFAPAGNWKTIPGVAAIRLDGPTVAATMAHAMDGDSSLVYAREALLPALRLADGVVMANLSRHKLQIVREWIESRGAKLAFLPPYGPDLNPIEINWSQVKRLLRSLAAPTLDSRHEAFATAYAAVTPDDIRNRFANCGSEASLSS